MGSQVTKTPPPTPISISNISLRIKEYREIAFEELGAPRDFLKSTSPEIFTEVAAIIARRITSAISEAHAAQLDLKETKQAIAAVSQFGGDRLLNGLSLGNRTLDELRLSAQDSTQWQERIEGELRTRLVLGEVSKEALSTTLQQIVSCEELRNLLIGTDGYTWVADVFCQGRMTKAHILMSAVCKLKGHDFTALGWQAFPGTTEEFKTLVEHLESNLTQYQGLAGYLKFSTEYAGNDMLNGYRRMSAVCQLKGHDFTALGWQLFPGTTEKFDTLVEHLERNLTQYQGLAGYLKFSEEYAGNDMQSGFQRMSAVCKLKGLNFEALGWQGFSYQLSESELPQDAPFEDAA